MFGDHEAHRVHATRDRLSAADMGGPETLWDPESLGDPDTSGDPETSWDPETPSKTMCTKMSS